MHLVGKFKTAVENIYITTAERLVALVLDRLEEWKRQFIQCEVVQLRINVLDALAIRENA